MATKPAIEVATFERKPGKLYYATRDGKLMETDQARGRKKKAAAEPAVAVTVSEEEQPEQKPEEPEAAQKPEPKPEKVEEKQEESNHSRKTLTRNGFRHR